MSDGVNEALLLTGGECREARHSRAMPLRCASRRAARQLGERRRMHLLRCVGRMRGGRPDQLARRRRREARLGMIHAVESINTAVGDGGNCASQLPPCHDSRRSMGRHPGIETSPVDEIREWKEPDARDTFGVTRKQRTHFDPRESFSTPLPDFEASMREGPREDERPLREAEAPAAGPESR